MESGSEILNAPISCIDYIMLTLRYVLYLEEVSLEKLVVMGVETLDDVDADDDVETELGVDKPEREKG